MDRIIAMIMAYMTVGFMVVPWLLLLLYIRWIVRSGYEDSISLSGGEVQ